MEAGSSRRPLDWSDPKRRGARCELLRRSGHFRTQDGPSDIETVQPGRLNGPEAKSAVPFPIERRWSVVAIPPSQSEATGSIRRAASGDHFFKSATRGTVVGVCPWNELFHSTDGLAAHQAEPNAWLLVLVPGFEHLVEVVGDFYRDKTVFRLVFFEG